MTRASLLTRHTCVPPPRQVFVLAASNLPWELDAAMLRRLEKRILVGLPTAPAREAMFRHHLPPIVCEAEEGGYELRAELDYATLAAATEGCVRGCRVRTYACWRLAVSREEGGGKRLCVWPG